MYRVISVSSDFINGVDYYDTNNLNLKYNDSVVVEFDGIIDTGICKSEIIEKKQEEVSLPLFKIIRKFSSDDEKQLKINIEKANKALKEAHKIADFLHLDMKFINARYTLDRKKLYFSYLSDDRIDFRELAKKLAQKYKTRIELRQVGVRDKAKIVGGLGPCGLFLCCNTFLTEFNSVSINMAKNQFLALNPSKINGVCDRLLCCLKYENDTYIDLKNKMPKIGSVVSTEQGKGKVVSINIFNNTYKVEIDKSNTIELVCE